MQTGCLPAEGGQIACVAARPLLGTKFKPKHWLRSDAIQELKYSARQQRSCTRIIRRKRTVGEIVLIAGIKEKLRVLDLRHNLPGGIDITLAYEDRVVFHPVNLDRHAIWPRSEGPFATDRQAGMEEESSSRSGPRLGQLLRRQHAEREPGIDERRRQIVSDAGAASRISSNPTSPM